MSVPGSIIEIQGLDIQVSEKKIREFEFEIRSKTEVYENTIEALETSKKDLEIKKGELDTIVSSCPMHPCGAAHE